MTRKRALILAVVTVGLMALVYLQFRTWKKFDWGRFREGLEGVRLLPIAGAVVLIYVDYFLRAIRWKIFLRPVKRVPLRELIAPQFIGFTGLALLGRPGELIRPYLIARRQGMSFASQIAVWMVERIFDIGAYTILVAPVFLHPPDDISYADQFPRAGVFLLCSIAALVTVAVFVRRKGLAIAARLEAGCPPNSFRGKLARRIRVFRDGLNTIHDTASFIQIIGISVLIWFVIAWAYWLVTHAYPYAPADFQQMVPPDLTLQHVILLMGFSIAGGVVQLPAVGGGSQLATIGAMLYVFEMPKELAVSCGILIWLVTFMAVIPAGLLLARSEHVSLRRLSAESHLPNNGRETA
ncbi:MAG TPA: lysylphosphatidylglycerol synthase transmembrane domain-containing protein [Terriglobales bacterium]|nr:lysylphosphatidylglycerol synthase transmembrane domain-containing protein [Terriglobales bacterium]